MIARPLWRRCQTLPADTPPAWIQSALIGARHTVTLTLWGLQPRWEFSCWIKTSFQRSRRRKLISRERKQSASRAQGSISHELRAGCQCCWKAGKIRAKWVCLRELPLQHRTKGSTELNGLVSLGLNVIKKHWGILLCLFQRNGSLRSRVPCVNVQPSNCSRSKGE